MKKLYKLVTKNTAFINNIMNLISELENYLNILESPRQKQGNFDAGNELWTLKFLCGIFMECHKKSILATLSRKNPRCSENIIGIFYKSITGQVKNSLFCLVWPGLYTEYFGLFSDENSLGYSLVIASVLFVIDSGISSCGTP